MGGTKAGGLRAAATNKQKHGADFYAVIGKKAADSYLSKPKEERKPRGMAYLKIHDPERFKRISAQGGQNGRRTK